MRGGWIVTIIALVAGGCQRESVESFSELDSDGNGRISRAEAEGHASLERRFSELDSDGDDELSAPEYLQAVAALR